MDDDAGTHKHWYFWGAGLLAVAIGLVSVGAVVLSGEKPEPSVWASWYAYVAGACLVLAILCGISGAAGLSFPLGPVRVGLRGVRWVAARPRVAWNAIAHWSPIEWRGLPNSPRRDDDDHVLIEEAFYASATQGNDVTDRVRALAGPDGRQPFPISNDTMGGDPEDGVAKTLTVRYRIGRTRGELSCQEGQTMTLG